LYTAYYNDGGMGYGATTVPFSEGFAEGDTIGVFLDFRDRRLEFFLNGRSLGAPYL